MKKSISITSPERPKTSNGHSHGHGQTSIWFGKNTSSSNEDNNGEVKKDIDLFSEREGGGGMRVGRDFQAKIPQMLIRDDTHPKDDPDKALLVWCPSDQIPDNEMEEYLAIAKDKFQYSGEQALGLLYWHHYEMKKSLSDLENFTPQPEEWTVEDKVLFEQAFQFHGKAFDRIRQMLPEKSMSSLIRYYYKWKKLKSKSSVMDRQAKKFSQEDENENLSTGITYTSINSINVGNSSSFPSGSGSSSDRGGGHSLESDSDHDKSNGESGKNFSCSNCRVQCTTLHSEYHLCKTCWIYKSKSGEDRPLTGPLFKKGDRQGVNIAQKQRRHPPPGMYLNHDDLGLLASHPPQAENPIVSSVEKDIVKMKYEIQENKQDIDLLKRNLPKGGVDELKPKLEGNSNASSRVNARWTPDEMAMAAQGIRRFGKNFVKIAEIIGTKNENHMKSFFVNYRRQYELEKLLKEYKKDVADGLISNGTAQ